MENQAKTCKECGRLLTLDHFRLTPLSADGHANICKDCAKQKRQQKKDEFALMPSGGGNPELAKFTPRELIEELRSRGYSGKLTITREIQV
ncbi:hypothetical protein [uncultured Alistipes sp.]|uniref:hypothetical protein n=1 Tax=uncultured Alistipes sp. TaxID=538949 RepID=UPI002602C5BD|nr:hypothetical protein [uncultured Alistipes sp.]